MGVVVEGIDIGLAMMIADEVVLAGRSQWIPVAALKVICQVNGVKELSENGWRRIGIGTILKWF